MRPDLPFTAKPFAAVEAGALLLTSLLSYGSVYGIKARNRRWAGVVAFAHSDDGHPTILPRHSDANRIVMEVSDSIVLSVGCECAAIDTGHEIPFGSIIIMEDKNFLFFHVSNEMSFDNCALVDLDNGDLIFEFPYTIHFHFRKWRIEDRRIAADVRTLYEMDVVNIQGVTV